MKIAGSPRLVGQGAPRMAITCQRWGVRRHSHTHLFTQTLGIPNSSPHACTGNTLNPLSYLPTHSTSAPFLTH